MTIPTQHPTTTKLHSMFGVKEATGQRYQSRHPADTQLIADRAEAFQFLADCFAKSVNEKIDFAQELNEQMHAANIDNIQSRIKFIGMKVNDFFAKTLWYGYSHSKVPEYYAINFEDFSDSIQPAFRNAVATFMGLLSVVDKTIKLSKANLHEVCNKVKTFMKDLAYMQINLFQVALKVLGVDNLDTICYKFNEKYINVDRNQISFNEKFLQAMRSVIRQENGICTAEVSFEANDDGLVLARTFKSNMPSFGCPAMFMPVSYQGKVMSFADLFLDWIQDLVEKSLVLPD